jgi:hypothetical protein
MKVCARRAWLAGQLASALAGLAPAVGLAAAADDIRDIRGPKWVWPAWVWAAVLAGVVLVVLAGFAVRHGLRRPRRARALLPFEAALERLEGIRPLMQPATAREFSVAVSDIVRSYIEVRFDITATHQTTEEFLHDLLESSKTTLLRHRALLSQFLHECDLVKFAGISLTPQNMESLHQSARAFVLETSQPEPETRSAAATAARPAAGGAATPKEAA